MIVLILSSLASPVVWLHYFVWLLPALYWMAREAAGGRVTVGEAVVGFFLIAVLWPFPASISRLAEALYGVPIGSGYVTFWAGLVTYLQPLAVVGFMGLLYLVDRRSQSGDWTRGELSRAGASDEGYQILVDDVPMG